jgi:hypothetical protein
VTTGCIKTMCDVIFDETNDSQKKQVVGPEKATRGGRIGANQNSFTELGLYPEIDSTPLSSNSTKTAQL